MKADEALQRLREGNERFVTHSATQEVDGMHRQREATRHDQEPFAIILGCSDSRVPAEYVFDQGLGDLFVIRIAGNIVAQSQVGSIEFAAEKFGVRLVVVMGHSSCGAVQAALESAATGDEIPSPNLGFIVQSIQPGIEAVRQSGLAGEPLLDAAVRENIRISVNRLQQASPVLVRLIEDEGLCIVGAHYSLATGKVDFL